jgi:hypothetical protein
MLARAQPCRSTTARRSTTPGGHRAAVLVLSGAQLRGRQRAGHIAQTGNGELLDARPINQAKVRCLPRAARDQVTCQRKTSRARRNAESEHGFAA